MTKLLVGLTISLALVGNASGQMPVCAEAKPRSTYHLYRSCDTRGAWTVARFIQDLAIDHAFKSPDLGFERNLVDGIAIGLDLGKFGDSALVRHLNGLAPVLFQRLDVTSGTFDMPLRAEDREFVGNVFESRDTLSIKIKWPERLRGGYWRTPATVQLAIWENSRPTIALTPATGDVREVVISCIVMTGMGIRIETVGEAEPDVLVAFDECL